jgi:drug/metabolite transporter (DMT)-like permease
MEGNNKAYSGLILATVFWASNSIAVKLALRQIPQLATAALRVTLAAAVLAALHARNGGRFHFPKIERRKLLKLSFSGVSLSFLCYTMGLNYTSVSHTVFINALVPVAVLLIARMHGLETITPTRLVGVLLSLAGVLSLALDQPGGHGPGWIGDLLVLGSVLWFAIFTVESKKIASAHAALEFNAFTFLAAALWFSPLLLAELVRLPWREITWLGWSSLLYSAVFGSAGAYLTYYYSLRLLPASRVAAFHYLQPVLATVLGVIIFHDRFTARFAIGAALILAGLAVARQRLAIDNAKII